MALIFHDKVPSLDDGVELSVRVFHPEKPIQREDGTVQYVVDGRIPVLILVHPYGVMGGSGSLMWGLAQKLSQQGYAVVSFDLRGVDESSGSCTFMLNDEVKDVQALCRWIRTNPGGIFGEAPGAGTESTTQPKSYAAAAAAGADADASSGKTKASVGAAPGVPAGHRIVIVGDSAGAPVAGSAIGEEGVVGYVSMGYPCGWWASILFSAHVPRMQGVAVPKLFMQGSSDGFTAPATLQQVVDGCAGDVNEVLIVPDKGHFELEDPRYDTFKCRMVHDFVMQYVMPTVAPELLQPEHPDGLDAAAGELGAQAHEAIAPFRAEMTACE